MWKKVKRKQGYKRGYSVILLVGLEYGHAFLWQVFSQVAKLHLKLELGNRTDEKELYTFHESVVDALRPVLEEGVRSIVVTAPIKTTYVKDFLDHVRKHHMYLIQSKRLNRATFAELVGSVDQPHKVAELVKTKEFRNIVWETTSGEAGHLVNALERNLNNTDSTAVVLYSLKEIEDIVYNRESYHDLRTEYLLLTDKYLKYSKDKIRIHRLLQISKNRTVKTRIIQAETPAGKRISQLGGIVFFIV